MDIKKQVESFYPLSPMQQGMLFHTLYEPGAGMYIEQTVFALQGAFDVDAFARAWEQVVERHATFRTGFLWEGLKAAIQVVHRRVALPWLVDDWRALPPDEQDARLAQFLTADRTRGFALTQAPLMRLALFRMTDQRYQFVWSQHHLLLDGWSLPLVLNELFAYYDAFAQGRTLDLARPRPYRDYITWLQRQDLAKAEAFWRQKLAGFTAATPLVVDHPAETAADAASTAWPKYHHIFTTKAQRTQSLGVLVSWW